MVGEHSHLHLGVGGLTKNANLMTAEMGHPAPPPSAHFQLFGGRQYIVKKTSRHQRLNRLTSINVNFVHPDDGDLDLIQRISAETRAKISWGLVTPC